MGKRRWALALSATLASGAWATSGCVDDDKRASDTVNTDTDTDTGSEVSPGAPAIQSFTSDFASITRGMDFRGQPVDGAARLSWETSGATGIELLVDGVKVSLDGCEPADCTASGSLVVRPTERTRFTLRALGDCDGPCPEASVDVEVLPPVGLSFVPQAALVQPGEDVVVDYAVSNHTELAVGLVDLSALSGPSLVPCTAAGDPCAATFVDGVLATEGELRVGNVDRRQFLGVMAKNGAADGLGDIGPDTFFIEVAVPVVIQRFEVVPERALPGTPVVLSWEVAGAQAVEVEASTELDGLTTCVGLGQNGDESGVGRGFCTVQVDAAARLVPINFVLRAEQAGGELGEAQARLEVIGGPQVAELTATPPVAVPGQVVTLSWTAFGADQVAFSANHPVDGLDACTALTAGRGSCEVRVTPGAPAELALTLTASHSAVGPPAVGLVTLGIEAAPEVVRFEAEDTTVEPGTTVLLDWQIANADEVLLVETSGIIPAADLARCAALTEDGTGRCELVVPNGLDSAELTFGLEAIGPTGARTETTLVSVTVGLRPVVAFELTPALLPQGGGQVVLEWQATGATSTVIRGESGVLMTSGETLCGAAPCQAAGDALSLFMDTAGELLLIAENDFGRATATAAVRLEGAPVIASLSLAEVDVLAGPALVTARATLSWEVEGLQGSDQVRLERAPSQGQDRGCAEVPVASWSLVPGFPKTGAEAMAGTTTLDFADAAACFRFIAVDLDTTPSQRATAVFLAYRAPEVTAFGVADDTVKAGDMVALSWSTQRAYRVQLAVSPVGAVTSQELAGCSSGQGCELQIQPGTPLGDVVFTLVAVGEQLSESAPRTVPVTIGVGPAIGSFTASPASTSTRTDVTLRWTSTTASALTITDRSGPIHQTTDPAAMTSGSHVVTGVTATSTWELKVTNSFGEATALATTFIGPSIDSLTANGGDAKDGLEQVVTGPVTVSWSTTSADGSHRLETANVPSQGGCAAATGWATVYTRESPTPSASHALGVVTANRCVRLTVTNSQSPPQTSSATFLLREMPEVASLTTSPSSLNGSGTVVVRMGVRGATALTVTAQYRNNAGEVLGTRDVCDQSRLNSGSLTGGANVDQVECAHQVVPCNLLCLNNGMPAGTTRVRYLVSVGDAEGDAASRDTTGADVVIQ